MSSALVVQCPNPSSRIHSKTHGMLSLYLLLLYPTIHPLIAFDHLSLYIQKHLGQSVPVCGILWKGRSWQIKVQPGIAGHSQVKPGTARYSAEKTHDVLYFWKVGALRISNMILRDISGVSTGATMGNNGQEWVTMGNNGATWQTCKSLSLNYQFPGIMKMNVSIFLASPDALEVIVMTHLLSDLLER